MLAHCPWLTILFTTSLAVSLLFSLAHLTLTCSLSHTHYLPCRSICAYCSLYLALNLALSYSHSLRRPVDEHKQWRVDGHAHADTCPFLAATSCVGFTAHVTLELTCTHTISHTRLMSTQFDTVRHHSTHSWTHYDTARLEHQHGQSEPPVNASSQCHSLLLKAHLAYSASH